MKNLNLNFFHEIPIEVYHESDTVSLTVFVNNTLVFEKTYPPSVLNKETITFRHEYLDAEQNTIKFNFNGKSESSNRFLKIKSIAINGIWLNIYNANYRPKLNPVWWNNLTNIDKEKYLDIIHGKNGNTFGWFGEIEFNFATGYDTSSRCLLKNNMDLILSKKIDWVFSNRSNKNIWERNNDKLL
jgi:hypothetical protein